jgi:hypothetical protein
VTEEAKPFDWSGYNPKLSMEHAMDSAQDAMHQIPLKQQTTYETFTGQVAMAELWLRVAQVHATNMQTEALRAAFPPPCTNG